jgi:phage FluMu protein Com
LLSVVMSATFDQSVINTSQAFHPAVKFLYCTKCKDVRVKAWYQLRPRCPRCLRDATPIVVKNSPLTYLTYALYFIVLGLVAYSLRTDDKVFLYYAIVGLVVAVIAAYADLIRGEKLARKRVKIADSDTSTFRRRGWI